MAGADLVVHLRILGPEMVPLRTEGKTKHRPVVHARVLEVLKGHGTAGQRLSFAQHGHGIAEYRKGEEALVFLHALEKSAELSKLASETSLRWYSAQEDDDDYKLSASSRGPTLAAAKAYAAVDALPQSERAEAIRRITVKLLTSQDRRLAVSALRDLKRAGRGIEIKPTEVPALQRVIDGDASIEVRVGVLAELDRRSLIDGDPRWAGLLQSSKGRDRLVVIRAVAIHPGPAADLALMKILAGGDTLAGSEAAVALGHNGNDAAVESLSEALASANTRLAMAAVRGLGGVGTDRARAVLESAASSHPQDAVRRKARAELAGLDRRAAH